MRNVSKINFIRKIPNQTLRAVYYPPKSQRDIDSYFDDLSDADGFVDLSPDEIKAKYSKDFLNEYRGDFFEDYGVTFRYKDGTEDVYTKSGYEHEIFEYLDRNKMNKKRYRVITDATHIDFYAGGRVKIDDIFYEVVKVINMTNDIPTQNKYRGMMNVKSPHLYAPKILALM